MAQGRLLRLFTRRRLKWGALALLATLVGCDDYLIELDNGYELLSVDAAGSEWGLRPPGEGVLVGHPSGLDALNVTRFEMTGGMLFIEGVASESPGAAPVYLCVDTATESIRIYSSLTAISRRRNAELGDPTLAWVSPRQYWDRTVGNRYFSILLIVLLSVVVLLSVMSVLALVLMRWRWLKGERLKAMARRDCPSCRFDLASITPTVCPECGTPMEPRP